MLPSEIVNPNITLLYLWEFRAYKSPTHFMWTTYKSPTHFMWTTVRFTENLQHTHTELQVIFIFFATFWLWGVFFRQYKTGDTLYKTVQVCFVKCVSSPLYCLKKTLWGRNVAESMMKFCAFEDWSLRISTFHNLDRDPYNSSIAIFCRASWLLYVIAPSPLHGFI